MGKYALLIGVSTCGEGLQPLPEASKEVAALREVLLNPQMGGFDEAKPLINLQLKSQHKLTFRYSSYAQHNRDRYRTNYPA